MNVGARPRKPRADKIELACAACGLAITVAAKCAGKRGRCPRCKKPVRVPDGSKAKTQLVVYTNHDLALMLETANVDAPAPAAPVKSHRGWTLAVAIGLVLAVGVVFLI